MTTTKKLSYATSIKGVKGALMCVVNGVWKMSTLARFTKGVMPTLSDMRAWMRGTVTAPAAKPAQPATVGIVTFQTRNETHTVTVNKETLYGSFENNTSGSGGGLWFERTPEGLTLTDYDGVYALSMRVIVGLRNNGFIVTVDFE